MAENLVTLKGSVPVNNQQLIGPVDPKIQLDVTNAPTAQDRARAADTR